MCAKRAVHYIDNDIIDKSYLNRSRLHLNNSDDRALRRNFRRNAHFKNPLGVTMLIWLVRITMARFFEGDSRIILSYKPVAKSGGDTSSTFTI